jgi:hypothetical protein
MLAVLAARLRTHQSALLGTKITATKKRNMKSRFNILATTNTTIITTITVTITTDTITAITTALLTFSGGSNLLLLWSSYSLHAHRGSHASDRAQQQVHRKNSDPHHAKP